jgi:MFS family permease
MVRRVRRSDQDAERENLIERGGETISKETDVAPEVPIWGFFFIGVVGLLCYNLFLQVTGLLIEETRANFATAATAAYGIANNVGQFVCIFLGKYMSMGFRITIACVMIAVVCIGYPLIINADIPFGFTIAVLITALMGLGNAIFQSAGFGLAAAAGDSAMNFTSLGQSAAGLIVGPGLWVIKIVFSRSRTVDPEGENISAKSWPAVILFMFVGVVTLLTIPYYYAWFSKNEAVKRALTPPSSSSDSPSEQAEPPRPVMTIILNTLPLALTVWVVLFGTFLVFPGMVLAWEPTTPLFTAWKDSYGSVMIFVFQAFDAIGKLLVVLGVKLSPFQTKLFTPLRLGLFMLFILSEAGLFGLGDDWARMGLVAVLAATNGLLITWCMILGPNQVRKSEAEVAGYTMSFFLVFGISCGALLAHFFNSSKTILEELQESGFDMNAVLFNDELQTMIGNPSDATIFDVQAFAAQRRGSGSRIYIPGPGNDF